MIYFAARFVYLKIWNVRGSHYRYLTDGKCCRLLIRHLGENSRTIVVPHFYSLGSNDGNCFWDPIASLTRLSENRNKEKNNSVYLFCKIWKVLIGFVIYKALLTHCSSFQVFVKEDSARLRLAGLLACPCHSSQAYSNWYSWLLCACYEVDVERFASFGNRCVHHIFSTFFSFVEIKTGFNNNMPST